jgi:hypothetical protein
LIHRLKNFNHCLSRWIFQRLIPPKNLDPSVDHLLRHLENGVSVAFALTLYHTILLSQGYNCPSGGAGMPAPNTSQAAELSQNDRP